MPSIVNIILIFHYNVFYLITWLFVRFHKFSTQGFFGYDECLCAVLSIRGLNAKGASVV